MNYEAIVDHFPGDDQSPDNVWEKPKTAYPTRNDHTNAYEFVRYGLPTGVVDFESVTDDRNTLINHYFSRGWTQIPKLKNAQFQKHVALFRCSLDLYEEFATDMVFSKDEIYIRCLREGPAFTEFIKKSRSVCLRAKTAETDVDIDEDYYFEEYTGYNSLISERYLIHWDDKSSVDDVKYAFIPTKDVDIDKFRSNVKEMFSDFKIPDLNWDLEFDMLDGLKATQMYDPITKRSTLMREFWNQDISVDAPYFARRAVVPTTPGSTRDTGVGDPSTILKVKQINMLCRVISEAIPYSANCPGSVANQRYKRVLKRNGFLHLDFKKFGLTFPRALMNVFLEEVELVSGISTKHLIIDDFTVEIDGKCYQTARGTMLGWLDAVNSLCVCAIIHSMINRGLPIDFVTFNDDVEISCKCDPGTEGTELGLIRDLLILELDSFDIPISLSKTYGSKASVFLERYCYFTRHYNLDMYKEQLTVAAYAKSLVTTFVWQAKLFHAAAEQWTKSTYATDRCIMTCPVEFRPEEAALSLWAGGWFIWKKDGMDQALETSDKLGLILGQELAKWKSTLYSTPRHKVSNMQKISVALHKRREEAMSSTMYNHVHDTHETLADINDEVPAIRAGLQTRFAHVILDALRNADRYIELMTEFSPPIT